MKKVSLLLVSLVSFLFGLGTTAQAQEAVEYFPGKWNVVLYGTPNGDAEMIMNFEKGDNNKLKGTITNKENNETIKIDRIEEKETAVVVYFFSNGYDISINLKKEDDNKVKVTCSVCLMWQEQELLTKLYH